MEKVQEQATKKFVESLICRDSKQGEPAQEFEAILRADGQPPSIGKLSLDSALGEPGHYYPIEPNTLDKYPLHGAILKLSGRTERLSVKHLQRCMTSTRPAYHIWFDGVVSD
jgi:hypothetical protein